MPTPFGTPAETARTPASNTDIQRNCNAVYKSFSAPSGSQFNSQSLNASGALLHEDGLELGPYLGETSGLVHVPDIAGVDVLNATAV